MSSLGNYRVSLKFSEKDDDQTEVVKLLKQMGRRKSQFITKAVKYYLENEPTAEIPMPKSQNVDKTAIKALLLEVLSELNIDSSHAQQIEPTLMDNISPNIVELSTENKNQSENNKDNPENNPKEIPEEDVVDEKDIDDFLDGLDDWE